MPLWNKKRKVSNNSIEVFGLCGAGKSTHSNLLFETLVQQSPDQKLALCPPVEPNGIDTILSALSIIRKAIVTNPSITIKALLKPQGRWLFLKLGYRTAGLRLRGDLKGKLLIDSGNLQPLISFFVEYDHDMIEIGIRNLLKILSLPSFIIYFHVSPETAMKRYVTREKKLGNFVFAKNLMQRFERGYETAEYIYQYCKEAGIQCAKIEVEQRPTRQAIEASVSAIKLNDRKAHT